MLAISLLVATNNFGGSKILSWVIRFTVIDLSCFALWDFLDFIFTCVVCFDWLKLYWFGKLLYSDLFSRHVPRNKWSKANNYYWLLSQKAQNTEEVCSSITWNSYRNFKTLLSFRLLIKENISFCKMPFSIKVTYINNTYKTTQKKRVSWN